MQTDLLSHPFTSTIESYLKNTGSLVIIVLNERLNIIDYNNAFSRLMKGCEKLTEKNILDFLIPTASNDPFKNPASELPQRLIFNPVDNSTFSLDCNIYHFEGCYLVLGGNLMLARDEILEKMSLLSNELINMTRDLHEKNRALNEARAKIKILSGKIPICSYCKKIRDDEGCWNKLENFINKNSDAFFSHSICPTCMEENFPDAVDDD